MRRILSSIGVTLVLLCPSPAAAQNAPTNCSTTSQNIYVPKNGIRLGGQRVSVDDFAKALAEGVDKLLGDPARAVELLGAIQSDETLKRLEKAPAEGGEVVLPAKAVSHPLFPNARVRTPTILKVSGDQDKVYQREMFGPIAYIVATESTQDSIAAVAEQERQAVVGAAGTLRSAGIPCPIVSAGSTPTAVHSRDFTGITEMRPGVYVFNDLDQQLIGSCAAGDLALSVLASVIGHYPHRNQLLVDAGALALRVHRDPLGHVQVRGHVHVDVAVAEVVLQHRHGRLGGHPADEALPAPRDGQVDKLVQLQQMPDRVTVGGRHQLHRIGG